MRLGGPHVPPLLELLFAFSHREEEKERQRVQENGFSAEVRSE